MIGDRRQRHSIKRRKRPVVPMPLLWFPSVRYRPAGPPADPVLRAAWELGRATAASDEDARDDSTSGRAAKEAAHFAVGSPENAAFFSGIASTRSGEPRAPAWLPAEIVLCAVGGGIDSASVGRIDRQICAVPLSFLITRARDQLERRRAVALGLTAENAPRMRVAWEWLAIGVIWHVIQRLRGRKSGRGSWHFELARSLISEFDRRRAWRRALRS